ncbi:MAG: DUF3891 family protein [Thermoleophilia bacterium]
MIVARTPEGLRLVRQADHAAQCAGLAFSWGNPEFQRVPHWGALVDAARLHDNGWRPVDELPPVGADGAPVDFPDLDRAVHGPMYARGIADAAAQDPRVGLLVSRHGQGLYEKRLGLDGPIPARDGRPAVERRFLEGQEALQRDLREQLDDADLDGWLWAAYRLLQAWDVLSLYACWGPLDRGETWSLPRVPTHVGDEAGVDIRLSPDGADRCAMTPWPFRAVWVIVPMRCRVVPDRAYRDSADLQRALDATRSTELLVTLVPG